MLVNDKWITLLIICECYKTCKYNRAVTYAFLHRMDLWYKRREGKAKPKWLKMEERNGENVAGEELRSAILVEPVVIQG